MNPPLSEIEAERIIETLADGVPDPDHVMMYSSSMDSQLMGIINQHLDKIKRGLTIARFVKGDNGLGKSHFLSVVREHALRENYVVSYFDLRSREGFDMIERILSKLIRTLSVNGKRKGTVSETVLDFIFREWAHKAGNIEESVSTMDLDATNMDFINAISLYGNIMACVPPRSPVPSDAVELLNRWFQAELLRARERQNIRVNNNITARNARDVLNSFAIFLREVGYSGWVILIDEQEIIPTLMTTRKRDLSNENLKVIIDTQPKTKFMYYLFATTPEFFTNPQKGINSYPALRQRVSHVLEVKPIGEKEMVEAAEKIRDVYCIAFPGFRKGRITGQDIANCAKHVESTFGVTSAKPRIFIVSYIRFLKALHTGPVPDPSAAFASITGQVWDELETKEREEREAFRKLA